MIENPDFFLKNTEQQDFENHLFYKNKSVNNLIINCKLTNTEIPKYKIPFSSDMNLYALNPRSIVISPFDSVKINTCVSLNLNLDMKGQIRPTSNLITKGFIIATGTFDPDFQGEIQVLLMNLGSGKATINNGDRIAQLVFVPFFRAKLNEVTVFKYKTKCNHNSFKNTGVKK